jgi:nicotinamidase-related amidase/predicted MFS family arabinose efflux permease
MRPHGEVPARADAFGWTFVTPLFLGSALNPINSSIIATALVPIATATHVSVGHASVLVSALYLASSVAQPTAGKLAEEFGPRRVFLAGILLVLLGGLVGGSGRTLTTLIVARVLIGIGTSAGYPSAMVLIRRRATWAGADAPPGGVLGGLAIAGMATLAVGPPIGGLLVGTLGWRAAFLVNLPVAAAALAMAVYWIPRDHPNDGPRRVREVAARIDVAGIIGFGGAVTALLVFLMSLPHANWAVLAVAVVAAGLLVWWELRVATPFLDVRRLASNLALTRTYLRSGLTLLGFYTVLYGVTQWLEAGRGYSAEQAGLLILPMGVLSIVVSRPVSRRNLVRGPLIVAALSLLAASAGVLLLTAHAPVILLVGVMLIFGITIGTSTVANQTALYAQAPADQIGTASGLSRTFGYLGSIASATITGLAFRSSVTDHGLHTIAIVLVAVGAVVLLMTLFDHRLTAPVRRSTRPGDTVPETTPAIDARHAVLLVMDYQPALLGSIPESEALLARLAGAIAAVRDHDGQIGYVRVAFEDADYAAIPATNKMFAARAAQGFLPEGAPESAVHDAVAPQRGDIMVRKTRVGAFSTTDLDRRLRDRGIDTLILAGISTSGVVLSTVRDAADRDYRVFVLADGSADPDAGLHETLTEKVFPRQAHVITTTELPALLAA